MTRGRCQGCGYRVVIDAPPDGHTRPEHASDCNCYGPDAGQTCPVPALCGPVTPDPTPNDSEV